MNKAANTTLTLTAPNGQTITARLIDRDTVEWTGTSVGDRAMYVYRAAHARSTELRLKAGWTMN